MERVGEIKDERLNIKIVNCKTFKIVKLLWHIQKEDSQTLVPQSVVLTTRQ